MLLIRALKMKASERENELVCCCGVIKTKGERARRRDRVGKRASFLIWEEGGAPVGGREI